MASTEPNQSWIAKVLGVAEVIFIGIPMLVFAFAIFPALTYSIPVAAFVLHVWTVGIAFSASGLVAAVLSAFFPLFSQIYWFVSLGGSSSYQHPYCRAIVLFLIVSTVTGVCYGLLCWFSEGRIQRYSRWFSSWVLDQ